MATHFNQVVLAAPDIDADVFRERIAPAIINQARQVTLYASSNDLALTASRTFNSGDLRAGDTSRGLVVTPGIETIDVSGVDTSLLGHSYYGDNPDGADGSQGTAATRPIPRTSARFLSRCLLSNYGTGCFTTPIRSPTDHREIRYRSLADQDVPNRSTMASSCDEESAPASSSSSSSSTSSKSELGSQDELSLDAPETELRRLELFQAMNCRSAWPIAARVWEILVSRSALLIGRAIVPRSNRPVLGIEIRQHDGRRWIRERIAASHPAGNSTRVRFAFPAATLGVQEIDHQQGVRRRDVVVAVRIAERRRRRRRNRNRASAVFIQVVDDQQDVDRRYAAVAIDVQIDSTDCATIGCWSR